MIQNILDKNGNVIGTLEVPDGTDQNTVTSLLALYTYTPPVSTPSQSIQLAIQAAISFGNNLVVQYAAANVLSGITQSGQTIAVATYLQPLAYLLNAGSLYAAISTINTMIADTSSNKANLAPFVTNNILYTYLNIIQSYLGIPLTVNPGT